MEYKIYIHCLFKSKTNHIPTYVCICLPRVPIYIYINVVKSIPLELIYSILQPSKKLLSGFRGSWDSNNFLFVLGEMELMGYKEEEE